MFSCEFCKILKNIYFEEHLRTTASELKSLAKTLQTSSAKTKWSLRN